MPVVFSAFGQAAWSSLHWQGGKMGRGEELTRIHLSLPGQASACGDGFVVFGMGPLVEMPGGFGSLVSSAVLLGNHDLLEGGTCRR